MGKKMIENGTLLQNRYLIGKQIGAGGMGAVYLAVDQRFDSPVAIKETFFIDDEFGEAFEREAKLLNSLLHPVLPHVSDYFTENEGYFLVMQFIEGEDLSETLKREGAFPVEDVMRWTDLLLDALDYLHSQETPIIHRDIKPHNLKLTTRGDIFLLDFGLAKLKSEDTTRAVSVFGYSRTYSPLEQIQGIGTDARSDIFALGATAYHFLTGKPPVDALSRAAAIVNGKADPLQSADEINAEIPNSVANVLNSALSLNPERRFASAKAMRQALENAVITGLGETVKETPEKAAAVVSPAVSVINSAENENFPALEAFAAEAAETTPVKNISVEPEAEISIPKLQTFEPEAIPNSTAVIDTPTKIAAPRFNQSRTQLVAFAAILLFGTLAIVYFMAGTNSPNDEDQSSVLSEISNTDAQQQSAVSEAPEIESSAEPVSEIVSSVRSKPVVIEKAVESSKTENLPVEVETTTIEKPKPTTRNPAPRSNSKPTPRRAESQNEGESRPRVVESLPDIESVFTGQTSRQPQNRQGRRDRREDRRRDIDQMSDEERGEGRRNRRGNRNRPPLPF